jgi:hypothetical protein
VDIDEIRGRPMRSEQRDENDQSLDVGVGAGDCCQPFRERARRQDVCTVKSPTANARSMHALVFFTANHGTNYHVVAPLGGRG